MWSYKLKECTLALRRPRDGCLSRNPCKDPVIHPFHLLNSIEVDFSIIPPEENTRGWKGDRRRGLVASFEPSHRVQMFLNDLLGPWSLGSLCGSKGKLQDNSSCVPLDLHHSESVMAASDPLQ